MTLLAKQFFKRIWQGRIKTILLGVFAVIVLLMFVSWLALPSYVKQVATQQVQQQIGRKLEISDLSFSPLSLTLTANGISLFEPDNKTPAVTLKTAVFSLSGASIYHRALVMDEILLDQLALHLIRTSADDHGRYNFSDILDKIAAMPKSESPFRFSLANVQVKNSSLQFDDKVLDQKIAVTALNLGLPFMSNFPKSIQTFVQPMLSAKINGTAFALTGRSKPFDTSLETSLAIDLDHLELANFLAYSPVALPVKIQSAQLTTKLDLIFSRKNLQSEILLAGVLELDKVALQDTQNAPLLKLASVKTQIKSANLSTSTLTLDKLLIDTPEVWAALDEKGGLNWNQLAQKNTPVVANKQPASSGVAAKADVSPSKDAHKPVLVLNEFLLDKGMLHFSDALNATPAQSMEISGIKLSVKQLSSVADAKLAPLSLSANLGLDQKLQFDGEFHPMTAVLHGSASLDELRLESYQAYLNRFLAANLSGRVSLKSQIDMQQGQVSVSELGLSLADLKLIPQTKNEGQIAIKTVQLDKLALSTETRAIKLGGLRIDGLDADIRRDANGKINLQKWLVPVKASAAVAKTGETNAKSPDWKIEMEKFSLDASSLAFLDQTVSPNVNLKLDGLTFNADNVSSDLGQSINLKFASNINRKAKLSVSGTLSPKLKQIALNLDAQALPLSSVFPYVSNLLNVQLSRGTLTSKAKISLLNEPGQSLVSKFEGGVSLNDFQIFENGETDDFLEWKSVNLEGINASIGGSKQFVSVRKLGLNDFFTKLVLSSKGKLNLRNIVVHDTKEVATPNVDVAGASSSAASKPVVALEKPQPPKVATNPVKITIAQTVLRGGNVNFTDNFIKPNYTANLTGLAGSVGSISSDNAEPATVALSGKIDNDAALLISGTLNPLSSPIFLDIKASANGIQLTRLSQYAAKYAGYSISKGSLSVKVAYRIENNQLQAENEVRLDQLTFGEKSDSPDATKLPVNLALALLRDNDGVIAINLPVSGSLSDPQFSIGGIIFKVLGNILTKAITSPFALLGAAFGGGDELAYVEFAPGSAALSTTAITKLDGLAKALKERSKLRLDIAGRVDPETDKAGLKMQSLDNKILAIKGRELQKNDSSIDTKQVQVDEADRKKYIEDVYSAEKFSKPRNMIGIAKTLPPEEAIAAVLANTPIAADALRALAQKRADLVFEYLEQRAGVSKERLFLIAPRLNSEGITDKAAVSRVDFSLK
ncbi:DUF748 domain-containing protein [Undibacterium parvum]|uniref:DUF748 domain-containing protein n=1 Tax=Undibacterium parvum TaxID=401471 RepID=A0A3Q9BSP0_9BURK|nr:DUF748 domain-containing protein [Undibacterium parvum]AZP13668.1 DUF748 domain-containing protein [Undibacterium parvum]